MLCFLAAAYHNGQRFVFLPRRLERRELMLFKKYRLHALHIIRAACRLRRTGPSCLRGRFRLRRATPLVFSSSCPDLLFRSRQGVPPFEAAPSADGRLISSLCFEGPRGVPHSLVGQFAYFFSKSNLFQFRSHVGGSSVYRVARGQNSRQCNVLSDRSLLSGLGAAV